MSNNGEKIITKRVNTRLLFEVLTSIYSYEILTIYIFSKVSPNLPLKTFVRFFSIVVVMSDILYLNFEILPL